MRGKPASEFPLTDKPGTCGGCKHFRRFKDKEGRPLSTGKCAAKPNVWMMRQSAPACKGHYKDQREPGAERKPGTCGGCQYFEREEEDGEPGTSGACGVNQRKGRLEQSAPACDRHYKDLPQPGCEGCWFQGGLGDGTPICDYLRIMHRVRGCAPGAGCDKRTVRRGAKPRPSPMKLDL